MNQLLQDKKNEGYWYSELECNKSYPMPVPNVLSEAEAEKIYQLILDKQTQPESTIYTHRGPSRSRFTGETVGSLEYHHRTGWVWPEAFAKHYVLEHKVKPTDEFLKFIGYIK